NPAAAPYQPHKGADAEQKWDSQGTVSLERESEGRALRTSLNHPDKFRFIIGTLFFKEAF
ncbi:MAG: hypothetical protein IJM46_00865, partial [Oscillospiraceae bacterium]|nr:hypothetical protein [Oscillospiraceae bacterium]